MSTENDLVRLDERAVSAIAGGFLMRSEQVRQGVAALVKQYPFAAQAAMVAGEFAILDAMTEDDKAFIKLCKERKRLLCEGGGNPSLEACYAVVAEAASKLLRFPSDDFSVWSNGTLYVKENGFRKLLRDYGASSIDVKPGGPKWTPLQDRKCWEVIGTASCVLDGKLVTTGDQLVQVNGNATDNPEKIAAHATRSLLKRLYKKVSSIDIGGEDEPDNVTDLPQGNEKRIEMPETVVTVHKTAPPEPEPVVQVSLVTPQEIRDEMIRAAVCCKGDHGRCGKMLSKDPEAASVFQEIWKAFDEAADLPALNKAGKDNKGTIKTFSDDVRAALTRWYELRVQHFKHGRPEVT